MPVDEPGSNLLKNRALRLLEYLSKVTAIRLKTVRDVNQYERVLWLASIPQEKECYSRTIRTMRDIKHLIDAVAMTKKDGLTFDHFQELHWLGE